MKRLGTWIGALLVAILIVGAAWAGEITGQVVGISDGDTVLLLVDRQGIWVRLDQIDAPEKEQTFGDRSRQSLSNLVFGKTVRAITQGEDRYGRTIATLYAGELNANAEQVRRGMAWVYRKYARDPALYGIEEEASAARRGLWSDPEPVPPWEWRKRNRK